MRSEPKPKDDSASIYPPLRTNLRSQLVVGFLGNTLMKLSGAALALSVVIILARVLGPAEYGVYAYVIALVSLLAVPVQAGLPTLVIRETARAAREHEWSILKGLWRWSTLAAGGFAFVIAIIVFIALPIASQRISEANVGVFYWGLALVPLVAWGTLRGAALTGLHKIVLGQLPESLLRPGILLTFLLAGLLWLPGFQPSANEAMELTVLAGLLSLITVSIVLRLNCPTKLSYVQPVYRHKVWFTAMWPLAFVAGMQVINGYADILILGFFTSSDKIGIYRVATQTATLVAFILQVVNTVVAPHFARMQAAGEKAQLQKLVTRSAQLTLLSALPIALTLILFGDVVLEILFSSDYTGGYLPLAILAVGQLINAGVGSVGILLNMTGHERETAKGVALAAFINIPLNLILIPVWGMAGAALATSVSLIIWNIVLWRAVRRHLDMNTIALRLSINRIQ